MISNFLGDWYTGLGAQTLAPKKQFLIFLFLVIFQQKINTFTMHLIILKWFRRQKCWKKRKKMRQLEVKAKEETVYKSVFIHLNTW